MRKVKKRFKRFDVTNDGGAAEYEELFANPLCHIIEKEKVIETIKTFSEEGVIRSSEDHIIYLVHWEEQVI